MLGTKEHGLHEGDQVLGGAKPEDVEPPEVRSQQQDVGEDQPREQVFCAVNTERAISVVLVSDLNWLQKKVKS